MDGPSTYEDFRSCLSSLEQVNRWSLGYRPTLAWLEALRSKQVGPLHIVDVGCGGGDLLRQIAAWARRRGISVRLTGIDLNPHAARAAAESTSIGIEIEWVTGDALLYQFDSPVDITVSSLMAHHLEDDTIVVLLQWMEATARVGWFINDLKRSALSCRIFRVAAFIARWHRFVQHDGPASFRRAFTEEDWLRLLAAAEINRTPITIQEWRPGRLCVGRWK